MCNKIRRDAGDAVTPWFILVTNNKVAESHVVSGRLAKREPMPADMRQRKEEKQTMTEHEEMLANATIDGGGCVLQQDDLYDFWPVELKTLGKRLQFWPEYVRESDCSANTSARAGPRW